jgi:hypothetical protein
MGPSGPCKTYAMGGIKNHASVFSSRYANLRNRANMCGPADTALAGTVVAIPVNVGPGKKRAWHGL